MTFHHLDTTISLSGASDVVLTLTRHIASDGRTEIDVPAVLVGKSMTLQWTMNGVRHTMRLNDARDLEFEEAPA